MEEYTVVGEVKLSSGRVLRLRAVPPYLLMEAGKRIIDPKPPLVEIESQIPGGGKTFFEDATNPQYQQALLESQLKRGHLLDETNWLYGLPDVVPPEDDSWKDDILDALPGLEWRDGKRGRKLDYIQYVVVASQADLDRIRKKFNELGEESQTDESLMESVEHSFRGDVQGNDA